MKLLKPSLVFVALGLSLSVHAKSWADNLIGAVVDKVVNTINTAKPTINKPSVNTANSGIPEVFQGEWGLINGNTNSCQGEDGMGVFIIDTNRVDGYEMNYVLKNQIGSLSNDTFTGQFKNDGNYGDGSISTLKLSLIGTENLRFSGFDGLLVKCHSSDQAKREEKPSTAILELERKETNTCGVSNAWIDLIHADDYVPSPCMHSKDSKSKQILCSNPMYEKLAWINKQLHIRAEANATKVEQPKFNKAYWKSTCETEACICKQLKADFDVAHDEVGGISGIDY